MENANLKRNRCLSFGPEEKVLIANICAKYKGTLENKKTDHISIHKKNSVWDKITAEVNASNNSGIFRSKDVLRRFYENRKREVRKIAAEEKKELYKTGGGRAFLPKKDECHDIFLSLMNGKTIYGLQCEVGGDVEPDNENTGSNDETVPSYLLEPSTSQTSKIPEIAFAQFETISNQVDDFNNESWKKYVPNDLLTPISERLRVEEVQSVLEEDPSVSGNQENKKRKYDGVPLDTASRRRPTTVVKALTRTEFGEKYNLLLDKRLHLIKKQEEKIEEEILSIKAAREAKDKLDALEYKIKLEKLKVLQSQNLIQCGTQGASNPSR
ncbi:uncharacterized protein LOC123315906 isoform X2 [Coccinella septempunctata]|uniref:uncharacterized protein LOC123315906 isoform X2 n=1 Tax=Coccinella septempunctata TaxID=41139 RepID=UPI001D099391|nr:uncharacterized protein LOC123315906 isoform X2 [Coccinella septempunctata]